MLNLLHRIWNFPVYIKKTRQSYYGVDKKGRKGFKTEGRKTQSGFNPERGKPRQGFTLIESLIYMALLSILLVILSQIFVSMLENQANSEAKSSTETDGRFILTRLIYDINRATSIVIPAELGQSSSILGLTIDSQSFSYSLTGGNLQLTTTASTDNLNSNLVTVSDLSFKKTGYNGGKDTVQIQFTVTSIGKVNGINESKTFQTTVGTR